MANSTDFQAFAAQRCTAQKTAARQLIETLLPPGIQIDPDNPISDDDIADIISLVENYLLDEIGYPTCTPCLEKQIPCYQHGIYCSKKYCPFKNK